MINKKNDNLTVFEPEAPLRGSYGRDVMIPLSQSATFKIKCSKWDLKNSPIYMELAYFQPQNKTEK